MRGGESGIFRRNPKLVVGMIYCRMQLVVFRGRYNRVKGWKLVKEGGISLLQTATYRDYWRVNNGGSIRSLLHLGQRLGLVTLRRLSNSCPQVLQLAGMMISSLPWERRLLATCRIWAGRSFSETPSITERSLYPRGRLADSRQLMMDWRKVSRFLNMIML